MPIISEAGIVTRAASVDIVTYFHDVPSGGVTERPVWTLALWLNAEIAEARLGYGAGALPAWPAPGSISLIPPGAALRFHAQGGFIRSVTCRYQPDVFQALTGLEAHRLQSDPSALLDLRDAALRMTLEAIAGELAAPGHGSAVLIESLSVAAAVYLARDILAREGAAGDPTLGRTALVGDPGLPPGITQRFAATGGLTPRQLQIVADHAEAVATGTERIAAIAVACGISVSHLSRAFKQSTGATLQHYLDDTRLRIARDLLTQTPIPIAQIATRVGFAHASALSTAFRRAVGVSPRTYRQRSGVAFAASSR